MVDRHIMWRPESVSKRMGEVKKRIAWSTSDDSASEAISDSDSDGPSGPVRGDTRSHAVMKSRYSLEKWRAVARDRLSHDMASIHDAEKRLFINIFEYFPN